MGAEGDSSVSVGGQEQVNLKIRCTDGSKFSVRTSLESTVGEFKVLLAQNHDVPAERQRLIYKGRVLKDDQTLASYGLQEDHTVHMVSGSAPAPAGGGNSTAAHGVGPNTADAGTNNVDSGVTNAATNVFPGLGLGTLGGGTAPGLFGAGLPEFEQMQQQLTQNPNMMREIMNMPAIQSIMNNPEIMRNLIMNNPQMREIIDRNPELAHVLNDPSILRQTLEAARNPELMREMMRNTDWAMSNIESSPEGFNMLRRMYENVQEPFLNATTMGGNTATTDVGSNPFAALLGNRDGIQNTGGSNSSVAPPGETTGTTVPNANPLPNPWSSTGGPQTNNATRTNATPPVAGLGGLGIPELGRMGMPDPAAFSQLLQNPAVSQMMQSLLSNPQYMDQIMNLNPQLRSMLDMNPQLREMMQNPDILRQLTSPETMQQMMALQQQLSQLSQQASNLAGGLGGVGGGSEQRQGAQNNMGMEMLMNMFGGLGAGGFTAPNNPDVPPEELYATQLAQLREMGFFDTQENIRALRATAGNVHAAVDRLLGNQ